MKAFYKRVITVFAAIATVLSCGIYAFAEPDDNTQITNKNLIVGVATDRCPVFYKDPKSHEIVGIGVDLFRFSAEKAGFTVTFQQIEEESLKDAIDNENYDIILPVAGAIFSTQGKPTVASESLFQMPFTLVTAPKLISSDSNLNINDLHVGMLKSFKGVSETVKQTYPGMELTFYDDIDEAVKALRAGKVEALLSNSYVWSYFLQKPSYNDLIVHTSAVFTVDFRAGAVDNPENRAIINQLNSGIADMNDTYRQAVILDYTSRRLYYYSWNDYLYKYSFVLVLMIVLVFVIVVIATYRKRSLKKNHEENLNRIINEDSLTCALSLPGFRKRVEEILKKYKDNRYLILYINISNFSYINESIGMKSGDDLLRYLAKLINDVLTKEETFCRMEGDHFVVLRRISEEEIIRKEYQSVVDAVRIYFTERGGENQVRIFSGIYVLTQSDYEDINIDHMIDLARAAEKRIRKSQKKEGLELYNPEQWNKEKRKSEIVSHLHSAIKAGEISVWYQPQVDYSTGTINGAEALCRWHHPKWGWISPSEFIPALEEAGLIRDLDVYVWECVCKDLKKWNEQGSHRTISVNLSRNDISDNFNVLEHFQELIRKYDLTPDQLRIEITETVYTEDPEILINTTKELKSAGFTVEMDDFGSGYSSLNILKDVPVDVIKLDLLFLRKSDYPEKSRTIISHIVKMVQELGMDMIVEGVETKEQASFLLSHGCSEMQGYYFYKPLPKNDFETAIESK